jgi:hypothetical protein
VVARVWNADKGVLTDWFGPLTVGGPTRVIADLPAAGRYLVEVRDGRDDARSPVPYTLKVDLSVP